MNFETIPVPTLRTIPNNTWRPPSDVRMISADDHNMEAEHLWEDRLPAKWKDKAPKLWRDANGWHLEAEGRALVVPGVGQDISEGCSGFWDLAEKLKVMDAEGIEASVLFHGKLQALNALQDKDLYWACMDVYNEWLAEYLKPYAKRLIGVSVLPTFLKPEASRDYMQKLKELGFKAVQMPSFPRGIRYNSMAMEPVWEAIAESGLPLSFHVGAYIEFAGNGSMGANLARNLCPYRPLLGQLMFAGIFERHPTLKVIFTEGGASWAATALSDMDYICKRYYTQLKPKLGNLPSFYWHRQCYTTFMYDPLAMEAIDRIGADNVMWSTDYPHAEGTLGYSGEIAREIWETVGPKKAQKILGGNAAKVWGI